MRALGFDGAVLEHNGWRRFTRLAMGAGVLTRCAGLQHAFTRKRNHVRNPERYQQTKAEHEHRQAMHHSVVRAVNQAMRDA
jgi:hypothetical protein